MMLWVRLSLRNTRRNLRRSLLTAVTVVIATALVTVTLAWIEGVFGTAIAEFTAAAGHIRIVDADFAAREELNPLYENIGDVSPLLHKVRGVEGVVDAQPRIATGVVITATEEIGDEFAVVVGGTQDYYEKHLGGPEHLAEGRWLRGKAKEVVLGRRLAARLKARLGSEVLMLGQTQYGSMSPITANVVGIVGSNAMLDEQAYVPLEEMRWLVDLPDGALEVLVYGGTTDAGALGRVAKRLRALPGVEGLKIETWNEREPWLSMIGMMQGIQSLVQFVLIVLAALAIFSTMSMSVLERTGEIGVMRAMGLTRKGAVGLFMVEALWISVLGSVVGAALGGLGGWYLQTYGVTVGEDVVNRMGSSFPMKATMYADMTFGIALAALLTGVVIAVLGAFLPSWRAGTIEPVVAMRARR